MKISVWGLTQDRGLPLALILRHYGHHSVVAHYPVEASPPGGHPDLEVRSLSGPDAIPIAPTSHACLRLGSDLAIVAAPAPSVQQVIDVIAGACLMASPPLGSPLPVVVVTPGVRVLRDNAKQLLVGYAPFDFDQRTVMDRLLSLPRIVVVPHRPGAVAVSLLRERVEQAWREVNNKIPILLGRS